MIVVTMIVVDVISPNLDLVTAATMKRFPRLEVTRIDPTGVVVKLWTYHCIIVFLVLLNMCFSFWWL